MSFFVLDIDLEFLNKKNIFLFSCSIEEGIWQQFLPFPMREVRCVHSEYLKIPHVFFELNLKVNSFTIESFWQLSKVHFYSVKVDGAEENEADRFLDRFIEEDQYREDLDNLVTLLEEIGERIGARTNWFSRFENRSTVLPPNRQLRINAVLIPFFENPFRLFCLRISDSIVILFNGGIKTSQKVQDSPDLSLKFYEAQGFVRKIDEAFRSGDICVAKNGKELISPGNGTLFIL